MRSYATPDQPIFVRMLSVRPLSLSKLSGSDPAAQPVVQLEEPGRLLHGGPHRVPEGAEQHGETEEDRHEPDAAEPSPLRIVARPENEPDHHRQREDQVRLEG